VASFGFAAEGVASRVPDRHHGRQVVRWRSTPPSSTVNSSWRSSTLGRPSSLSGQLNVPRASRFATSQKPLPSQ
jgi:hypothetical protein